MELIRGVKYNVVETNGIEWKNLGFLWTRTNIRDGVYHIFETETVGLPKIYKVVYETNIHWIERS